MVSRPKASGFTIVELLIVIVVIGILAAITIVAYNGIQQRANKSTITSDLRNTANIMATKYVDSETYPTTIPTEAKPSRDIVLQLTNTGSNNTFCINAYHTRDSTLRMSWDSTKGSVQTGLCSGATIGSPSGGSVPIATRGVNTLADFSQWTLSGGAAYNAGTGELTLGASGTARSPIVRVDMPALMTLGVDLYATTASPSATYAPQAGYHTGMSYFGADGTTPVLNSIGYANNGCARGFPINAWAIQNKQCSYNGGPNVVYASVLLTGSNGTYSSPDLKIKNPTLTIAD